MEPRPWHSSYPAGIPAEVDTTRYRNLPELCRRSSERHGDRIAFANQGAEISFAEFERRARDFAAWLSANGLGNGDRVAVMLPNLLQSPIVIYGILRAGLVVVNVNPLYTAHELEHQLKDSGARAIVVLENFAGTVAEVLPRSDVDIVIVTGVGDAMPGWRGPVVNFVVRHIKRLVPPVRLPGARRYRNVMHDGRGLEYEDPALEPDALAFLQYTGGTTGVAKGAMLTHANLVSNVVQLTAWVAPFIDAERDVTLTPLPLYHIFALTVNLFSFIELGTRNVLVTNPRDMPALIKLLKSERFAFFTGVNTLFNALLHAKGFDQIDFSGLKIALAGGMAVQSDVASSWRAATGVVITQGYGLTEASPVVSANRLDVTEFTGSIGLPLPSTDVAILDESGGRLPVGEIGEIAVKGPQVMRGYWQREDETRATFSADGWLLTGDMGRMDTDGRLYIEDRKKDMIIVSGFKVYPNEVEDVVMQHPDVLEAAAIGVPDERSGEAVKVFVVRKNPNLDAATVIAHCRERLTGYKSPDLIEFVDELPKTNVGKVLRRALK